MRQEVLTALIILDLNTLEPRFCRSQASQNGLQLSFAVIISISKDFTLEVSQDSAQLQLFTHFCIIRSKRQWKTQTISYISVQGLNYRVLSRIGFISSNALVIEIQLSFQLLVQLLRASKLLVDLLQLSFAHTHFLSSNLIFLNLPVRHFMLEFSCRAGRIDSLRCYEIVRIVCFESDGLNRLFVALPKAVAVSLDLWLVQQLEFLVPHSLHVLVLVLLVFFIYFL